MSIVSTQYPFAFKAVATAVHDTKEISLSAEGPPITTATFMFLSINISPASNQQPIVRLRYKCYLLRGL